MAGTRAALLALSACMGVWMSGACLQPVCESPGSCPHPTELADAGGPDAGVDAGPVSQSDAGSDAGADAGPAPDAGPDGGDEIPCTQVSDCPSGTDCDFRCSEPSPNQPYYRYLLTHGVCRPNPWNCTGQPEICQDPTAGYCDFEGRCVKLLGLCQKPVACPEDCTQAGSCGCICPTCPATAGGG